MRILLADDHPLLRRGLRQTIESEADFEVVAEAANGVEALRLIEQQKPQVAILDLSMPEMGGFDLAAELQRRKLGVAVVFLTMHKDKYMFDKAMDLGVKGYVLKDTALDEIMQALRSVRRGQRYISPPLFDYLLERIDRADSLAEQRPGLSYLTPTERRVLRLIAEYKTSKEIADELHIHHRTVDNHRTNIANKIGLQGSHALLRFAVEHQAELS
ncbi:MAG TPA: response regulator transcription factor [Blastocatellia bacterium]|jgi:DNA-binding NarL/FixJ family response regulator